MADQLGYLRRKRFGYCGCCQDTCETWRPDSPIEQGYEGRQSTLHNPSTLPRHGIALVGNTRRVAKPGGLEGPPHRVVAASRYCGIRWVCCSSCGVNGTE